MPDPTAARERRASPRALRGDEDVLYREYAPRLRRAVRSSVHASDDQIEDACASAWLILLRVQPRRETAFAFLRVVAVREAWRLVAADRQHAPILREDMHHAGGPLDPPAPPRDLLAPMHARDRLRTVTAALQERQLRLIALQALGYSLAEIAQLTGETPCAVNRHITRAKRRLDPLREPLAA